MPLLAILENHCEKVHTEFTEDTEDNPKNVNGDTAAR